MALPETWEEIIMKEKDRKKILEKIRKYINEIIEEYNPTYAELIEIFEITISTILVRFKREQGEKS